MVKRDNATVSAPGKVLLLGEYAVLEGAVALVSSVSRRVFVGTSNLSAAHNLAPEVREAHILARSAYGLPDLAWPELDVASLYSGDQKLGLGSSAAAAVAAAGRSAQAAGANLADADVKERLFDLAFAAHRAVAPQGSGADVAASAFGGTLRVRRTLPSESAVTESPHTATARLEVEALAWPTDLGVGVVWTGTPVRTSSMVEALSRYASAEHAAYAALMANLKELAWQGAQSFYAGQSAGVIEAVRGYGEGLRALGQAAQLPIYTERLNALARAAAELGLVAKPSGAGGGDVAVVFYQDKQAFERLRTRLNEVGCQYLDAEVHVEGVRSEPQAHG